MKPIGWAAPRPRVERPSDLVATADRVLGARVERSSGRPIDSSSPIRWRARRSCGCRRLASRPGEPPVDAVVFLGRPAEGIGAATLLVADRDGIVRTVLLDRIQLAGWRNGSEEGLGAPGRITRASPWTQAFGMLRRGQGGARRRRRSRDAGCHVSRARGAQDPLRRARRSSTAGTARSCLSAVGTSQSPAPSTPVRCGSRPAWSSSTRRRERCEGSRSARASRSRPAAGCSSPATPARETASGPGWASAAYTPDGEKLWHVLDGQPVGWLQATGGYAYVVGRESYPQTREGHRPRRRLRADGSRQAAAVRHILSAGSVADRVQPPLARDALEIAEAEVGELDAGSRDEVLHRAGDDDRPRLRFAGHSRPDADGDSRELRVV